MHQVAMTLGAAVEHGGIQCDAFQQGSRSASFQRWWCCAHHIPANNGSRRAARRAELTGGGSTTSGQRQRDNRAALRWTGHWRQRVHCSQECGHHRKFGFGVGCPGQGHSPSSAQSNEPLVTLTDLSSPLTTLQPEHTVTDPVGCGTALNSDEYEPSTSFRTLAVTRDQFPKTSDVH